MSKQFTFFCDKGWREGWNDRGGVSFLIKSFMEEFTSKDNVRLLIKVNMSYGCDVDKLIKELDIQNKNLPTLSFITENLPYNKLVDIYNMGDVFICPSLSEGFGLGFLQANACGLPVICQDFGGQTDFIKDLYNGWLLKKGKLKKVDHDNMYEGINWKYPDIDEISKRMRWCFENQNKVKKLKSNCLKMSETYSWTHSAKIAVKCLKEL